MGALLDPDSPERRALDPWLVPATGLSRAGLQAGLEAVGGALLGGDARRLLAEPPPRPPAPTPPALVVLSSNLPGLALQTLLPALARRRPVLFKSARAEPYFTPALLRALVARLPELGEALAAATWAGGDPDLEAAALRRCAPVLVYGTSETIESLAHRSAAPIHGFGPKLSFAWLEASARQDEIDGLAHDIALFDQRGCLSVQWALTTEPAAPLARDLARALARAAVALPPGPVDPAAAAALRQTLDEASMRGLAQFGEPADGVVLVEEEDAELRPSPGLRCVRIYPAGSARQALERLERWRGRLQGAVLIGEQAWSRAPALRRLGLSRLERPGRLQATDALWHNGGVDPFELF